MNLRALTNLSLVPLVPLLVLAALPTGLARLSKHVAPVAPLTPERGAADLAPAHTCHDGYDALGRRCARGPDARYADAGRYVEEDLDKLVA